MSGTPHILIVDDEQSIRLTLEVGLSLKGFHVSSACSANDALALAKQQKFDAVICDVYMPERDGLSFVREIRKFDDALPVILITAQGSVELAVQAVEEGASDFIAKPFEVSALATLVKRHLAAKTEKEAAASFAPEENILLEKFSKSGLIGRSPAMVAVYKLIAFAARTTATVLVTGETGTGKELVARAIHDFSSRREQPFISVNCAGLTETLLEAELFGYVKGAFTGAAANRSGLFEAASGGTIFLDELAGTSANFQASLLRVLQSGEVRRVGSTETCRVNVRVIGASNQNLQELTAKDKFRPDLYYRLSVLTIDLPPLRTRVGDVHLLTQHFLQQTNQDSPIPHLTEEVLAALNHYDFPGNVRELENAIIRANALATNKVITIDCLPTQITASKRVENKFTGEPNVLYELAGDRPTMEELQLRYLRLILTEARGNRRRAAERLGLDRRTIQRLIARYNLLTVFADEDEKDECEVFEKSAG